MDETYDGRLENLRGQNRRDKIEELKLRAIERNNSLTDKIDQLQAENKRLKAFVEEWDGHDPSCGRNSEGFEGCDITMFNCDCGYTEAKRKALQEKP